MKKKKILISGAYSKTSEALVKILLSETDYELVLLTNFKPLDPLDSKIKVHILNVVQINQLKKICYDEAPDVIVVTNGVHNINYCESYHNHAWSVNVTIVENFLTISRVLDAHLIMISSDQVFDGRKGPYTEEDKPNPQNYFGKTKHAAENSILANLLKSTVIRTSMIYNPSSYCKPDFINDILSNYQKHSDILVEEGIYTNPTLADDIALAILKTINKKRYGIYNVAGPNILNNIDIHKKIAEEFSLVQSKFKYLEYKPKTISQRLNNRYGLITLKAETDLAIKFTSFQNGLSTYKYRAKLLGLNY